MGDCQSHSLYLARQNTTTWGVEGHNTYPQSLSSTTPPKLRLSAATRMTCFLPVVAFKSAQPTSSSAIASQDTAANKLSPPNRNSHPYRHLYQTQGAVSSVATAVTVGPWVADDSKKFVESRAATCCSVPSSIGQPPQQSCRNSAKDWAASSTSIATDQVGSCCESLETPITCIRPSRQVCVSPASNEINANDDHIYIYTCAN